MSKIIDKAAEVVHIGAHRWLAVAIFESIVTALGLARIAFGPLTHSPRPALWLGGFVLLLFLSTSISLWSVTSISANSANKESIKQALLSWSSLPFLVAFAIELVLLEIKPGIEEWIWMYLSNIQPFPFLATIIVLLSIFAIKAIMVTISLPQGTPRERLLGKSVDLAVPAVMLLIGVLQASVYLTPIGNAFLRFWAIADAIPLGIGYPVTLTEPGPMQAGSPPYVFDLPLFPTLILGMFSLLGHNSAAAYLPSALFNVLFPFSLYLLLREATRSRTIAIVFSTFTALFPYLRFWVLNLPDPDPFLLTSMCLAAYFYLRALAAPIRLPLWVVAGLTAGVLSLARPEGLLYAGFLTLGIMLSRPKIKYFVPYLLSLGAFVIPMTIAWIVNFGFLWPQNYNRTLRIDYPIENYNILDGMGALGFYHRGLGLSAEEGVLFLILVALSVLIGVLVMAVKDRRLLAIAIPGIGNTVMIFFANPYIPNTFHFADFFRHASFGIPLLVVTAAYGLHQLYLHLYYRPWVRWTGYIGLFLLVLVVVREGDILANPTATHRPGADQVLTTYTYLSMQDILNHPFNLPQMSYYQKDSVIIAHCTSMAWPEDAINFYQPLDMAFDSRGRPFGYTSVAVFIIGLCFTLFTERWTVRKSTKQPTEGGTI